MDHPIPPPDEEELLLSKLVFGDNTDFYNELQNVDLNVNSDEDAAEYEQNSDSEASENGAENDDIGKIMDDQLFFVDDGAEAGQDLSLIHI